MASTGQRIAAEFGGTAFLLTIVVGSGITAQRMSAGNDALALLANSVATGAGLYALIAALAPISAHFNPAVTALALWRGIIAPGVAAACIAAQFAGAVAGVFAAHAMFEVPLIQASSKARTGWALALAEFVATVGLLAVVSLSPRRQIAAAVAMYITAAYWFTASTSFANPAATVARGLTNTFAGIAWPGVPWFICAQAAAVAVVALFVSCRQFLLSK